MGKCAWLTLSRKRFYWGIIAHTESQGFEQTPEPKCYTLVCVTDVIQLLQHRLTGKTCLYLHFHKTPKTPFC